SAIFFYSSCHHTTLHSFPTRRSSDLEQFVFKTTRVLVDDLAARAEELVNGNKSSRGPARQEAPSRENGIQSGELAALCIPARDRSEEHTSELQSLAYLVCRLLLEKKK